MIWSRLAYAVSRRERNRLVIDVDTFLTALYVMVDNFCQSLTQKERLPAPMRP
jgi:hypothetical protein